MRAPILGALVSAQTKSFVIAGQVARNQVRSTMTRGRLITLAGVVAVLASLCATPSALAITYDAGADFSQTTNPNGVWSFGQYVGGTVDPATFSAYTVSTANFGPSASLFLWHGAGLDPNVGMTTSLTAVNDYGIDWQPGKIVIGPAGGPSVVRFTAPATGTYNLAANFAQVQGAPGEGATAFIFNNGTLLFTRQSVLAPGGSYFNPNIILSAGDQLDFGAFATSRSTQLSVTIGTGVATADFNNDGMTNLVDYGILTSNWLQTVPSLTLGDMDNNGVVNLADFASFRQVYHLVNGGSGSDLPAVVPEPSTMMLSVAAGILCLLWARKRARTTV